MISQLRSRILILGTAAVALFNIAGCTKVGTAPTPSDASDGTFADRSLGDVQELYIVTLQSPPLMNVAQRQNGHWVISDSAKHKVLNEP